MQDENDDNIVIRKSNNSKVRKSNKDENNSINDNTLVYEKQFLRNLRIATIITSLISVLTLIALFSYTPKDELISQLSFREILNIFKSDDNVISKIETTHNWLGVFGAIISNWIFNNTFGFAAIILPIILLIASIQVFIRKSLTLKSLKYFIISIILGMIFSTIMGTITSYDLIDPISKEWSGVVGKFLSSIFINLIGKIGSLIFFISIFLTIVFLFTPFNFNKLHSVFNLLKSKFERIITFLKKFIEKPQHDNENLNKNEEELIEDLPLIIAQSTKSSNNKIKINRNALVDSEIIPNLPKSPIIINDQLQTEEIDDSQNPQKDFILKNDVIEERMIPLNDYKPEIIIPQEKETISEPKKPLTVYVQETEFEDTEVPQNYLSTFIHDQEINYVFPGKELLVNHQETEDYIDEEELKSNARTLQEKLETFRIYIEDLNVTPGPVVTQYEFVPAAGIKISRIAALADDIAMALKAKGIRIIAPIPGKGTVGIEIPNKNPSLVRFSSIVNSSKFINNNFKLPLALGKAINGEVLVADLSKMPHLLVAGATGSGKSVGINSIISSLIYKKHPSEIKFVIIDPKKVELRQYAMLENHFIATSPDVEDLIITDPSDAVITLKAVCAEMDQRYDILAEIGQRNIIDYNIKVAEGAYKNDKKINHRQLPYIVVIIDELADLMLTASKEVETPIIRLAQLARAVGIHLVIATQRPSVDVITGIIKANFPARIAYQVASKIDSRTILDGSGAETLLGNGDMLFSRGSVKAERLQNSFLSTDEVENICNFIGEQKGYSKPYMLPSIQEPGESNLEIDPSDRDVLFEDAARLVIRQQVASVSMLQRRLKVGYARAGRIIDELEAAGVIGPFEGSKSRIVLFDSESFLESIL